MKEEEKFNKEEISIRKRQEECKFLFAAYEENNKYNIDNNIDGSIDGNKRDAILNNLNNEKVLNKRKVISSSF